jgi:hypothetical protein
MAEDGSDPHDGEGSHDELPTEEETPDGATDAGAPGETRTGDEAGADGVDAPGDGVDASVDEAGADEVDAPGDGAGTGSEAAPEAGDTETAGERGGEGAPAGSGLPEDVAKYERFQKMDGAQYERVNDFLRDRTYVTAREWAIARLCADFRTETGVEMTKIGDNLPELVPFMEDTYSPQAVNQARSSFEEKVRTAGATFLYGAMCDFFTAEELDDLMYEATEVAKFLLEVEGVDLTVEEELAAEDRISSVMREVRSASEALRYDECPECGHDLRS